MKRIKDEPPLPDWPEPVRGGKYLRVLENHVRCLRERHPHGNRELFGDDVILAHLLAFFNPTLRSLRTIEDFSQTRQAQRHLSIRKLCKSTLSDFHRLADPTVLQPIIAHLHAAVRQRSGPKPAGLPDTLAQVLAVDGSFFTVAADVTWAVRHGTNSGEKRASARLDVHLDVVTWVPEIIDVCGAGTSEAESAARLVRPGAIHVYDRGIFSFELIAAHAQAQSFYVNRINAPNPRGLNYVVVEERALTDADRAAGVLSDRLVRLPGSTHRTAPEGLLREVVIASPTERDGHIRLLTNLLNVEAHILGLIYRYRWQIELFFRWLKVFANFEHLISQSRSGILLGFYVAVIGVLLIYLFGNAKPSKYAFSLLSLVAQGGASLEEIAPILQERERQIALVKARLARRRAEKKN